MSDAAQVAFASDEAGRFEQDLGKIDDELLGLANAFMMKYDRTGGRGWPERQLRRRVGFRTYVLKIVLNPDYLQNKAVCYELREQWMYDFGELFTKVLSHNLLALLTPDDLSELPRTRQLVATYLTAALGNR